MRYSIKIALIIFGVCILAVWGCKRQACFHCYLLDGGFEYSKNGDTFRSGTIPNRQWLQDSVNLYVSQGYAIDWIFAQTYDVGTLCDTPQGPYRVFPDSCVFEFYK